MSTSSIDLGEIQDLAKAIGLTDSGGGIRSDWLSRPGDYLSSVIADDTQRNALIDFIYHILGEDRETDADGLIWLQVVKHDGPDVGVYVVLDPTPADYVALGAGVRLTTADPASDTSAYVPIFRAAKTGHSVTDPILIGQSPDAKVRIRTEITIGSGPPLGGIGLQLKIPTAVGASPEFALSLKQLQLPGASAPQDLNVSAADVSQLEQSAIKLVIGLVKAQADALGAGPLSAFIGLIGLDGSGSIPHLPLDQLASQGVVALATWFESVMSNAAARAAWLGNIATLLGGAAAGDEVTLAVGPAQASIGVQVASGSGGHAVVTPILGVGITQGDFRVRVEADLLRLDLATMAATALPNLAAYAQFGKRADGGTQLLSGDPQVDCVRVGITLDQARKPNFLLAADSIVIAGHQYPTLDLSTPDAIAQSATTVLGNVVDGLIAQLGPIGDAIRLLLGLTAPPSAPGATLLDIAAFLHDPLAAVRTYWRGLLRDHPAAIVDLLTSLRDLISDASQAVIAVSGSGTEADPWRLPIVGPLGLDAWSSNGGDVLDLAISSDYVADNLGLRCTRVESSVVVGLVQLDLATGSATFLPSVEARLAARVRGGTRSFIGLGPLRLTADSVGLSLQWKPRQGVSANVIAPNLAVEAGDLSLPFALPVITADGSLTLDAAGWDALEQLIGLLAAAAPLPWIGDLVNALGWGGRTSPHLRLADLATDATSTIKNWLIQLAIDEESALLDALNALARQLTGSIGASGLVAGRGTVEDPWRMPILPADSVPEVVAWLLPDGPGLPVTTAPEVLRSWQPGSEGLLPGALAQAIAEEAASAPDIYDLINGRPDLATGFSLLLDRWASTDGRIVPPDTDPAGVTVHRIANLALRDLSRAVDFSQLFAAVPGTIVRIAMVRPGDPLPWPDAPADHVIDLRAPNLAPESFPPPVALTGDWFISLARRADARLASGDADGTVGQAARISRVLSPFSSLAGGVLLVADSEAGYPALAAANTLNFVSGVVTLGAPFDAVAFTVLDDEPAADAFRLLRVLLPPIDENEPDDEVLGYARGLVEALGALLPLGDPGTEIRPPANPVSPRADLPVHAFFGVASESGVRAGMTAIVAAGLSMRAMTRGAQSQRVATGARLGVRLPVRPGTAGITVSGFGQVELCGVDVAAGVSVLSTTPSLRVHLEVRRVGGWLVGGPGTGLGAGDRPTQAVRWLEANLTLPFGGGDAREEIVLHDPAIFGIERERWVVRPDAASVSTAEIVSPALPEIRALLASAVEQISLPAFSTPAVEALLRVLRNLGVVASSGGVVPDAVEHLLHDPAAHIHDALADASQLTGIASGLTQLLTGLPGLTVDLAARKLVLDTSGTPGDLGMANWAAHLEVATTGTVSGFVTLGSTGTTAAGGALLKLETGPFRVTLEWHRPGLATPDTIRLWPSPDAPAIARVLGRLLPAECARLGLEYLRALDDTAKPIIDVALDAIGLLSPAVNGRRDVLLPAGLFQDPAGWFAHDTVFGAGGGYSAPRVATLLDALKPILGIAGNPGEWNMATGVIALADADNGNLRLGLRLDTSALAPIPTAAGRLVSTGAFSLTIPPNATPKPSVTLSLGLAGASPGRRAVYVELSDRVRVYVRPDTGADLSLYPDPPGLADLAATAVTQALPLVLDALASQTGANLQGDVGEIVSKVGDGLNLRSGAPAHFDGTKLKAWATDPVASLVAALPTLTGAALNAIATALGPALPAAVTATVTGGNVTVAAGGVSLTWQPSPMQFTVAGTVTGISGIDRVQANIVLDSSGLKSLSARVGPCVISAGGVTFRPYLEAVVGESPAGGRRIGLGLALDAAGTELVAGQWNIDGAGLSLIAISGTTTYTDPVHVALQLVQAVLDLVADFVIHTDAVKKLLDRSVGSSTVRGILTGVVLDTPPPVDQLSSNLFEPAQLLHRVQNLAGNLAAANPSISIGSGLTIGLSKAGTVVQIELGVNGRIPLTTGDVVVSIEADSRWIQGQPPAGIAVGVLDVAAMTFTPSLSANGIGIRVGKSSGPLLDVGLSLGSIAVHLYGAIAPGSVSGGVQLQLSDLAVGVSGAQGGNPIARGMIGDSGNGQNSLAPSFSPALAVQKQSGGPVLVSVSAGDGNGPWWLVIQKGFGPIYIEQVGFGVTVEQDHLKTISLLLDGRVSVFGLTAAVDELQLTFVVGSDASLFDPSRWAIDLGGLAISADMAGLALEGGLRKFGDGDSVEYVGMLLARFAVYGLSVYGGYGSAVVDGQRFTAFFAFGAINGPIGGPPAFFLTGIGGGLGINRDLIFPSDLSRFGDFPFLKALDPAAKPSDDPMAELAALRQDFPMRRGEFWFAAGISFTCFSLVDAIAVVSVKIGDGLEIALLGLARMALPRPQFPLVSIELALIVRFSTSEGVLWIQAQLTDNSWLLDESVRLTGGFAFVTWFKGPNSGQFVLTLGGYHPQFHRDGYPQVPRLGFSWSVSDAIVIKGENYFALTSEALMAGGMLLASAHFGPAWAEVKFGADGIIYFDPFRYEIDVYASISAGVTIDVWIGEITISVSLGAKISVSGPKFHGKAEFDVGPVSLTVEFGDSNQSEKVFLTWEDFVRKYLEEAAPGVARVLTAIPGKGSLPPGTKAGGTTETGTADGSVDKPFEVFSEFEITVTTLVPTQFLAIGPGAPSEFPPSMTIGVAPVNVSAANSVLTMKLLDAASTDFLPTLIADVNTGGSFPMGVWGPPQPEDDRKVPAGEVLNAVDSVRFEAVAKFEGTLPKPVKYNQVETGTRKPLPFVTAKAFRPSFLASADNLSGLLPTANDAPSTFAVAMPWLQRGGYSRTALAALQGELASPPRLGSLTQELAKDEMPAPDIVLTQPAVTPPVDYKVYPPRAIAVMSSPALAEIPKSRTTAQTAQAVTRVPAPTMDGVKTQFPMAVSAKLIKQPTAATAQKTTLISTGPVPLTRMARSGVAAIAARGAPGDAQNRLNAITNLLGGTNGEEVKASLTRGDAAAAASPQDLLAGEVVVLQMPNATRDVLSKAARPQLVVRGSARVVAFSHGGEVLLDGTGSANGADVPMRTERIVVVATGDNPTAVNGLAGWHSGQELVYVGWGTALAAGSLVHAEGARIRTTKQRFRAGWLHAAELVSGTTIISTRFNNPAHSVAILIDDPISSDAARGLALTLEDADRAVDQQNRPLPPVAVVVANRTVLIYSITPTTATASHPFTVSVGSQDGWHLAGVMAGDDAAESLAQRVAGSGLDALVAPLVFSSQGTVQIAWSQAQTPPALRAAESKPEKGKP
jgi:large repetitive protein